MSTRSNASTYDDWHTVWIGLGGNVGNVHKNMVRALKKIDAGEYVSLESVSSLYKTPPWGEENQDWFLNAAAKLKTKLDPIELLDFVKDIESQLKREKTYRWGPRTIDIDLLIYEDIELKSDRLTLPHPRMIDRAFVLLPLSDIAPSIILKGEKIEVLLQNLDLSEIEKVSAVLDWR